MQLSPSISVAAVVKHYLLIRQESENDLNYRLFSDGNPGIVFHLKDPLSLHSENKTVAVQPRSFLYGQITHFNDLKTTGKLDMLIVVLQPHGLYALLGLSADEFTDSTIPLSDLLGNEGRALEDQVLNAAGIRSAIDRIEQFFSTKLQLHQTDSMIRIALSLITQAHGIISVAEVLKKLPVTERQLERKFKMHIGITPKKFLDVVKFHYFLKSMQRQAPDLRLSSITYNCGYYDQAHLNNYFKKSVGITPLQYLKNEHLLAVNFLKV